MKYQQKQNGSGLLEAVIGIGIVTLTVIGLTNAYGLFLRSASAQGNFIKAQFLLEEGVEAVRSIRDEDWSTLSSLTPGATYWLFFDQVEGWVPTTTPIVIDALFERTIVFNEVDRDANDDITESGTLDTGTLHLSVALAWKSRNATTTSTLETYFTDLFTE